MISVTTDKDKQQLKEHALSLLEQDNYEGLVILIEELQDTNFEFPKDFNTDNSFCWVSTRGYLETVKYLVKQGVDIHVWREYALRWSSKKGYLEIVRYLIGQGADIHVNNEEALQWACAHGHLEVVKYLVEHGANIRARARYALRLAVDNNHTEIVKYLEEVLKNDSNSNR